ncbi:MAG: acetyl-CoA carboxylase carboxyl transferase subunit beta, partial [Chloroflexi bacterium]|nr:acetyl-CoA carboxylase carboxyl transferase subunit beta [Chloroflexota bacterium]
DFGFMGGSMGAVVGEKVARAAEQALIDRIPLIVVSASGGARMQEGTLALMQLAKTCAALERLRAAGVPYISVMSDPTTGGVFASYAVLGDVNLAEPNALIGFAGARVTAGTTGQELPANFQRAEFLFQHGFVDRVVQRNALRGEIAQLLRYLTPRDVGAVMAESTGGVRTILDPVKILTSLADRYVPEAPASVNGEAAAPPAPATTGQGRGRGR